MNDASNVNSPLSMDEVRERFQNLHELVAAARARLNRNVWDYLIGGAETETSVRRNRLGLDSLAFRPRIMRDVNTTDTAGSFLGRKLKMPIALAPIGSIERFDPAASAAVANAAGSFGCAMFQSSVSTPDLEVTAKEVPEGPKVFQLYVRGDHAWVEAIFDRAVAAGFGGLCLTVDTHHYSRRERDISKRYAAASARTADGARYQKGLDWKQFDKLRKRYKLPMIVKGIATGEDARLAVEHGVDVVYVSNHGGRQLDHGLGTIDVLPEVVAAVGKKAEIIIDGSFCRGTDVLKAIALGADTVCVGRLYALGMAAAGRNGIYRVLELLHDEMVRDMGLLGVNRLAELDPSYVRPAQPVRSPHVLSAFPYIEAPDDRY
ncbi:MAG: alpha-hydroxy-acid oxidizing protein [Alphaproteobacteria bacterium]|nr:alpha-hydroxy-acid oxidizing protein [Alphaproteobacteria bacterium]